MAHENTILLSFADKGTADYVRRVCTRKGITLESYILENFEWDDQLQCLSDFNEGEKITAAICLECEYIETCPDAVKKKTRGRS
jgi:hypothetical protein